MSDFETVDNVASEALVPEVQKEEVGTEDSSGNSSDASDSDKSSGELSDEESSSGESEECGADEQSDSVEDSFETVKDTTIALGVDASEATEVSILLDKVEPRPKSVSPTKAANTTSVDRASSSPLVKTPGGFSYEENTAGCDRSEKDFKSEKIAKKSVSNAASTVKQTPPLGNKAMSSDKVKVEVKEVKNEPTPKSSRNKLKQQDDLVDDPSKELAKLAKVVKTDQHGKSSKVEKIDKSGKSAKTVEKLKRKLRKTEALLVKSEKRKQENNRPSKRKSSSVEKRKQSPSPSGSDAPGPSNRIQKVPPGRRFQRIAISRAKLVGLIKDGQLRILQITEALKKIDQVKFTVLPTSVCRNYYKCPGTGLPHIRRHLRNWQLKYGGLIRNLAKLHLNMALAAEKSKLALIGPEASNEYSLVFQFESDIKHTETAKPQGITSTPTRVMKSDPSPPMKKIKMDTDTVRKASKKEKARSDSVASDDEESRVTKKRSKAKKEKKEAKAVKTKER